MRVHYMMHATFETPGIIENGREIAATVLPGR
jgi:hypothetical protein